MTLNIRPAPGFTMRSFRLHAFRAVLAAAALALGGCGEQLRQATQLFDPPTVPTDSRAAEIERTAPYPNVFEGAFDPPRKPLLDRGGQQGLESDLERTRATHVDTTQRRIEARRER